LQPDLQERRLTTMVNNKGALVVISGPSGSGKGTVVKRLREIMPEISLSVSATTRNPREGEVDGREYYFITRDDFEDMVAQGEILEFTSYCGNYYGTPKKEAERITGEGKDLILEIEVDGASQIKRLVPDSITIMLIPPTVSELEHRLRGRATETEQVIANRLARARDEIKLASTYDYVVVNENDGVDHCAEVIRDIIRAERNKSARMTYITDKFLDN
jgi:guanylate kinase